MGVARTTDDAMLARVTGGAQVLHSDWRGSTFRPGHILLVDTPGKAIVLVSLHGWCWWLEKQADGIAKREREREERHK